MDSFMVSCTEKYQIHCASEEKEANVKEAKFELHLSQLHTHRWGFYSYEGVIVPFSDLHPFESFCKSKVYFEHEELKNKIAEDLDLWEVSQDLAEDVFGIWTTKVQAVENNNCITEIKVTLMVQSVWAYEEYLLQRAMILSAQETEFTISPAPKIAVEALETRAVMEEDCGIACSICMEAFEEGEEAIKMPCKHLFHSACILSWLDNKNSCPNCRVQLSIV